MKNSSYTNNLKNIKYNILYLIFTLVFVMFDYFYKSQNMLGDK